MSASRASRAGTRSPGRPKAPARSTATCQTAVAAPIRLDRTAVVVEPPTARARRRPGVVGQGAAGQPSRSGQPVGDAFDEAEGGGRGAQGGSEEAGE